MNHKNTLQPPDLDSSHELAAQESAAGNPAETSPAAEEMRAERDVLRATFSWTGRKLGVTCRHQLQFRHLDMPFQSPSQPEPGWCH